MKRILSVLTNIAYGVAGLAQYLFSDLLLVPSIWLGLLMLGSGYHHYHMQPWSKKWDFIGMYGVLVSSICFGVWGVSLAVWIIPPAVVFLSYITFGSSESVVAVLIGTLLVVVVIKTHFIYGVGLAGFAALPFTFNMLGDTALKKHHDPVHGIGWHVPSATALMGVNVVLVLAHLNSLPLV